MANICTTTIFVEGEKESVEKFFNYPYRGIKREEAMS